MPPIKPMTPVSDMPAAIAPTRNEPCSSPNTIEATFGCSTTLSTMAKWVSGKSEQLGIDCVGKQETDPNHKLVAFASHFPKVSSSANFGFKKSNFYTKVIASEEEHPIQGLRNLTCRCQTTKVSQHSRERGLLQLRKLLFQRGFWFGWGAHAVNSMVRTKTIETIKLTL